MKITLIIIAHNEEKFIGDCLLSIQKYGKEISEVIVVNNGSTDRTALIVKSFPNIKLINEDKNKLSPAMNQGWSEATGDLIAFIDGNTKIPKSWTRKILQEFESKNTVSLSGPYIYYDHSFLKKFSTWIYWMFLGWPLYILTGYKPVSGNFVVRKSALAKIGGFNENIPFYGNHIDTLKKLHKIGKTKFMQSFYILSSSKKI